MSCCGACKGKSSLFKEIVLGGGTSALISAPQAASLSLFLPGRYEQEAHKRATVENDFVVFKKVRVGVSCSTWILSTHSAQSPVLGWEGKGREILMKDMLS